MIGGKNKRPGAQARADGLKAYAALHGVSYKQAMMDARGMDVTPDGQLIEKAAPPPKLPKEARMAAQAAARAEKKAAKALEKAEHAHLLKLLKEAGKQAIGCPPYGKLSKASIEEMRDNVEYTRALADPAVIELVSSMQKPFSLSAVGQGRKPRAGARRRLMPAYA